MKNHIHTKLLIFGLIAGTVHAAPLLEETFTYDVGAVNGQDGGTGFSAAWAATRNNPTAAEPGLTWGSLGAAGNTAKGNAWSGLIRPIGTTLSDAGLMTNGATLWFSVIFDLTGQNTTNADLNLALGTDKFVSSTFGDRENLLGDSAEGIGVTHTGARIQGVYWQDLGADGVGERNENNSSTVINGTGGNLSSALIVGKIEWGADDLAMETLTLYAPGPDLALGTPIMAAWEVPALDQSLFDSVALQFKDTSQMDEIRFGATSDDVLPPIPDTSVSITSFVSVGDGKWELTLVGAPGTTYEFRSSTTLQFDPGTLVESLTQGDPGTDPGVVTAGKLLTTDSNGDATVRMTLSGAPADFVRAQTPAPPLSENFDAAAAPPNGWVSTPSNGTAWGVGTPSGVTSGPIAASSAPNCAGTNISGYYTENADATLTSPVITIPAGSGATLTFQQFIDTDLNGTPPDLGSVLILDADNADAPIAGLEITGIEGDGSAGWTEQTLELPALDVGGKNIKVQFRFVSNAGTVEDTDVYSGFYVDDVTVTIP